MRWMAWLFFVTISFVAGCGGESPSATPPELPYLKAKPDHDVAYIGIIGDSYTSGLPPGATGRDLWPALVAILLEKNGVRVKPSVGAKAGSGYGNHATPGSVAFTDQVRQVVGKNDDLVILFGAASDKTVLPDKADELALLIQKTLEQAKKAAPNAKLLVIGPAWSLPDVPPEVLQVRDILEARAKAIGAVFIDPLAEQWFAERPEMFAPNDSRPNEAGQLFMAERIAPVVAQQLGAPPVP